MTEIIAEKPTKLYSAHKLGFCHLCGTHMVMCSICDNNCCNGSYGIINGVVCMGCPSAYNDQELFIKNIDSVEFTNTENGTIVYDSKQLEEEIHNIEEAIRIQNDLNYKNIHDTLVSLNKEGKLQESPLVQNWLSLLAMKPKG